MNQVSEEYGDLEKLSEGELMEILKSLEADEEDEENSLEEVDINHLCNYMPESKIPWWSSK